jgi:hypothetical protein
MFHKAILFQRVRIFSSGKIQPKEKLQPVFNGSPQLMQNLKRKYHFDAALSEKKADSLCSVPISWDVTDWSPGKMQVSVERRSCQNSAPRKLKSAGAPSFSRVVRWSQIAWNKPYKDQLLYVGENPSPRKILILREIQG